MEKTRVVEGPELKIASFSFKIPILRLSSKIQIRVLTREETIIIETNVIDHLTNELQIIELSTMNANNDFHGLKG
ncbi:hypothetical protein LOAG_06963 [Loa loa]|uniref:Uncharacterized protein n=1 Tax=Loa loa TaxID=7209 RepID=A0A1S0TYC2_LOALO|nr:hypothetical protein LOAG_06963 [Loa loa]EFO21525.1 hypothetical protein LOAG_06963 [Loa loa]